MTPLSMLMRQVLCQARSWGCYLLFGISLCTTNVYAAIPGDVCGSNTDVVDISDALCTLRYVVGLIPKNLANDAVYQTADVLPLDPVTRLPKGGNGVDISDALGILRHVVNLDTWISATAFVSGTAAAGAPIIGSVTIKDSSSPAATKTVPIAADGKYTVDVTGLKAPYMVRADGYVGGNEYHLYSAGTSADVGGTINITPLTDLIVANIAKTVASDYFNSGNFSTLTTTELKIESDALAAKLQPILTAVGVSGSIDLLRASFNTDHTGLDAALDILRVNTTNTSTGEASITNIITQQSISSTTPGEVLTNTNGVEAAVTDIQAISAGFKKFSDLFAAGLPAESNPNLLGLFDGASFLQEGQDLAAFLSEITTDQGMIGISFTNISIQSMDANGNAVIAFDVMQNGKVMNDGPEPFHMIKKSGVWYMRGDQYIAHVNVEPRAEYRVSDTNGPISTGLSFGIEDRGGRGITSAVVTGAGLPAGGVTLINNIATHYFEIAGQNGGNLYSMADAAIAAIADSGESYTVKLYIDSTLAASYTEKLKKRPYLGSELTVASFPTITYPTVADLRNLYGLNTTINATVNWTLPAGLTNDWLSTQVADDSGNSAMFEAALLPTDTSKSFILNPVTSTGQTFTITHGWLWLGAWDSYGRLLSTTLW